jgi:mono/diheme cytochrome c family protein
MTRCRRAVLAFAALFAVCTYCLVSRSPSANDVVAAPASDQFTDKVKPILAQYCVTCHNDKKMSAGLTLEPFTDTASTRKNPDLWAKVKEMVGNKQMPPKSKPQPADADRKAIVAWVDSVATKVDCGLARDPGRPTIRRLNRNEYNNTIRDLVGVDFKPAENFPSDDVGYGFDNIGDVLSMPPLLLEKYLAAAEQILDKAIVIQKPIQSVKNVRRPQNVGVVPFSAKTDKLISLTTNGAAYLQHEFSYTGEYILRIRCYGSQAGKDLPKLEIQIDRKAIGTHEVEAVEGKPNLYTSKVKVTAGRHDVRFAFVNEFEEKPPADKKDEKSKKRGVFIDLMEIEGPFDPIPPPPPASHTKIFIASPTGPNDREATANKIIEAFATKAYRRPVKPDELSRLMKLFAFAETSKEPFEQSVKHVLKAVLVSPNFLFRIERDAEPNNPQAVHPVDQYELATRLSYFLWSTMPDEELFRLASEKKLREPGVLEAQVRQMLKDPKAGAIVQNFAGQWLMLRTLATLTPDSGTYKNFDPGLRSAMIRETEMFFEYVMREDRSVLEFLDSDYTFVNDRLARHYGITDIKGSDFRKVTLTDKNRGGIITQASVLTVTSNPTRTSPVKRGKWILENILGTPPPPPPPDVPELPADSKAQLTGSLRQRMEQHRSNPNCAVCHAKLDPLGFGLENFDGVGTFRQYDGKFKIDPSGELPDGSKFSGPEELRKVLVAKGDLFRRNLAEKMLTYALGRGLEYYDRCAVEDIVKALKKGDDKFVAMMLAVVQSDPFQRRRGGTTKKKE